MLVVAAISVATGLLQPAPWLLVVAIGAADFEAIRSRPFTGTCPIAFDGQEIIFDFGAAAAIERVASCQVAIDWSDPLFVAAVAAVGPFLALPF